MGRRIFSREFKLEAVRLPVDIRDRSTAAISKAYRTRDQAGPGARRPSP